MLQEQKGEKRAGDRLRVVQDPPGSCVGQKRESDDETRSPIRNHLLYLPRQVVVVVVVVVVSPPLSTAPGGLSIPEDSRIAFSIPSSSFTGREKTRRSRLSKTPPISRRPVGGAWEG